MKEYLIGLILLFVLVSACAKKEQQASSEESVTNREHRCANCGMLTAKYPKWEQVVITAAGDSLYFDGSKCMFSILLDSTRLEHPPQHILVKDYYTLKQVDGEKAWYVIGSDVLGPMGHELVAFRSEEAAREFLSDHQGKQILTFDEVDAAVIGRMMRGMQMK